MRRFFWQILAALLALAAITFAWYRLASLQHGLDVTRDHVGSIPVTVYRQADAAPAPVIVVAHGFAGSQQLMLPFATTLARNGYVVVTFDFPGHGLNAQPLSGGLRDFAAMQSDLVGTLGKVARYARALPGVEGRVGLLGHSMAADIVVRYASTHADVDATVAVSLFLPKTEAFNPRNLLIVDGALESEMLRDQAFTIIGETTGITPKPAMTYGDFADGSARRLAFARGVEHISVLYSSDAMHEALAWFDQTFKHTGGGFVDTRGPWLGLLFLGVAMLVWPLGYLLPHAANAEVAGDHAFGWRRLLLVAGVPALITPLLLWHLPISFLPLLLGDYLAVHFAVYGLLLALAMWLAQRGSPALTPLRTHAGRLAVAVMAAIAYSLLAIGLPLNAYVFSFMPGVWRLPLIGALMLGTLPYFIADEWLTRRLAPMRGAYALSKLCFLLSLVIAIALNLERLFFLIIIVPVILLLFIAYGLLSGVLHRRTGHPLVAAIANAFIFAWFIAVTFPIVAR